MTSVRRRLAAASLVLLLPALAACGGFQVQTNQVYQPAVGVNDRTGEVDVLGAVVVSQTKGSGTFVATFVNQGSSADKLTGITGEGVQAQVQPVEVKPGQLLNIADQGAISISGEGVAAGDWVRLHLEFESGQKTEMNVPVVTREAEYGDVKMASPGGSPSPSASPTS